MEKRSEGGPMEPSEEAPKGKKPVVIYIMVLFIAAFLLMAWSFASHQRSNTEALGRLQDSVGSMQEVQDLQNQVIALQKELAEAKKNAGNWEKAASESDALTQALKKQLEGMAALYALQQKYSARDFENCRRIIQEFEDSGYADCLPEFSGVTSPAERYRQLKEAVEAAEAQEGGTHS